MRPPPPRTASAPVRRRATALRLKNDDDEVEAPSEETAEAPDDEARSRGFASLALASGTGEDVAALGTKGMRPRFRMEGPVFRAILVGLAILLLVLWGWLALRLPASSDLMPGDGPESSELVGEESTGRESSAPAAVEADGAGASAPVAQPQSGMNQDSDPAADQQGSSTIVVYVSGQIHSPGVYELPASSRVNNLVEAAGGLAEDADATAINLAAPLADAQHIHVPAPGEEVPLDAAVPEGAGSAANGTAETDQSALINVNSAGLQELQQLPGIGPALASAIVEWREANGPFTSVEDLLDVPGIGDAKLEQLRSHATA